MNAVGQQLAAARGGTGGGQRQALAEACDGEACDGGTSPWGVWVSGLGGFGNVLGNGNSQTLTYNFVGTAAGIDYRFTPNILLGLAAGYTNGQQWVDSFFGKGWSNTLNVTAYGSFTMAASMPMRWRATPIPTTSCSGRSSSPACSRCTANGSTGANQFLGQVETGYKIGVFAPAATTVTPFARLQPATSTRRRSGMGRQLPQPERGATDDQLGAHDASAPISPAPSASATSARSTWGCASAGCTSIADTGRPMTAAFAGAPANGFTVYGATPQRDCGGDRPRGQHRRRRRRRSSTSATTASSAAAPTITPSPSASA